MIHLEAKHLDIVHDILARYLPEQEVWAFGSRVHGRNLKPYSDLDLAIIAKHPLDAACHAALVDAFSESDLPFKVDLVDWCSTDQAFRALIEAEHRVLQKGKNQA